ncbi:hypothetical protein P3T23_007520 [Paraburkholderia sp. GAS448]
MRAGWSFMRSALLRWIANLHPRTSILLDSVLRKRIPKTIFREGLDTCDGLRQGLWR